MVNDSSSTLKNKDILLKLSCPDEWMQMQNKIWTIFFKILNINSTLFVFFFFF